MSWCGEYNNGSRRNHVLEKKMVWVFAQVFLAFALAVFIVWWTFPKNKKPPVDRDPKDNKKD